MRGRLRGCELAGREFVDGHDSAAVVREREILDALRESARLAVKISERPTGRAARPAPLDVHARRADRHDSNLHVQRLRGRATRGAKKPREHEAQTEGFATETRRHRESDKCFQSFLHSYPLCLCVSVAVFKRTLSLRTRPTPGKIIHESARNGTSIKTKPTPPLRRTVLMKMASRAALTFGKQTLTHRRARR